MYLLIFFFFLNDFQHTVGVLTGYQRIYDITNEKEFGCNWLSGGILTCNCYANSKVSTHIFTRKRVRKCLLKF